MAKKVQVQALNFSLSRNFLGRKMRVLLLSFHRFYGLINKTKNSINLSPEEVNAVKEGLHDFKIDHTYSYEEVMPQMKTKYLNLFK